MLKDLIPQFAEVVEQYPQILQDNYSLKEGIYVKVPFKAVFSEDSIEMMIIDKKTNEAELDSRLLSFFKHRDMLSTVLNDDMNKSIDTPSKKIHSTNMFTFFAKKDYLFGKEGKDELTPVQAHYFHFLDEKLPNVTQRLQDLYPMRARKIDEKAVEEEQKNAFFQERFSELTTYISSEERQKRLEMIRQFWKENFNEVMEYIRTLVHENNVQNYIKIFFDVELSLYEQEYDIYVLPRIFNVNTFNELLYGEIVGLPAYDISMNSKKPFFEMKTRKTPVPTRVTLEEALMIKNFSQWLLQKGKFQEITIPFHEPFGPGTSSGTTARSVAKGAYYLTLDKNGSIDEFDHVPFNPDESWALSVDNILERQEYVDKKYITKAYDDIKGKSSLRTVINKLFFNGYMPNNLLSRDAPKPKENVFTVEMVSIYMMTRQALFDYLVKDTSQTIQPFIKKYSLDLIENQLLKTIKGFGFQKIADAYQVRLALLKEMNDEEGIQMAEDLKEIYTTLKAKLQTKNDMVVCDSDAEFFFLAGQLGSYLLSQSVANQDSKNYGIAEPIIKSRNARILQNKLIELFDTYKHAVRLNHIVFNNAMAMVQGYDINAKIVEKNRSMLIAGLCANNLFYQKLKQEGEGQK
ncbi:hypothetical protein [Hazenella coriacea]|uniref:CRISPR-associated protein Csh1 n=1 Tax=Hazenella coriacea TaxID=1179467 RepID=A0A4R3L9P9_9BACL|nr:hypothetical protein [Hazenella coriacea]TCS94954.1 CRISPR-associated protein Csh1 [Hazenella coriacea]